jgi:hypothetical protein
MQTASENVRLSGDTGSTTDQKYSSIRHHLSANGKSLLRHSFRGPFGSILPTPRSAPRRRNWHKRPRRRIGTHAPEVECIGKGKAHRPYEFGVKVSVATTLAHAKGGQFVTHVKALPGNPYDGHTLKTVIPEMEALIGNTIERILADKGYRGHNAPPDYKFRVFTSGQKRRMTPKIKRELRPQAKFWLQRWRDCSPRGKSS